MTAKQVRLIFALLVEPTCKAACRRVGVPESSFYRWHRDADFREMLDDLRERYREQTVSEMARLEASHLAAREPALA